MTSSLTGRQKFGAAFLLLLVAVVSLLFVAMIRGFLQALLLGAIFSGMLQPVYRRLVRAFRGRKAVASAVTLFVFLLVLLIPLSGFLGIVVGQAVEVSQSVGPWVERQLEQPDNLDRMLERLPFYELLRPYQDQITSKIAEFAGRVGSFFVASLAHASRGTALFFFDLFVMLYAMFFFLIQGRVYLDRILYYIPLSSRDERRLVERFASVARATIKGTLLIGVIQGGLAGLGFWVAGINGFAFWSVIMMVLSIIPGVGSALVWVPAVIYSLAIGKTGAAIGLGIWCAVVVGLVDNLLRPRLVGRDTEMSDLLILLGTLGGIVFFGAAGFIIGPIIAALFVTVWEIYGEVFHEYLPEVESLTSDASE